MASSKGAVNFQELVTTGTIIEIDPSQIPWNGEDEEDEADVSENEYEREIINHSNLNCVGSFEDEEIYDTTEPFAVIESKMVDIFEDGEIKKRVLRQGYGETPEKGGIVKVHYNGYIEYVEVPFDSTYARKRAHQFVLGSGEVIEGLDIAVRTMKLTEKSQFMIKPSLAYGALGCFERIPPNATVLFEVELIDMVACAAVEHYDNLPQDQKKQFEDTYKMAKGRQNKAKDLFRRQNFKAAVKEYNTAASALEFAQLDNQDQQVKQEEMLFKLYSNLLVCYTKMEEPKRGCINFNKMNNLTKGTGLKLTAKSLYNNAKCLRMLGEYSRARQQLKKAYEMEPRNSEILNEFQIIDDEQRKYQEQEQQFSKAAFGK